jgi:ribonuclease D
LKAELEAKGRLSWQMESCARLIADCSVHTVPDPNLTWRIKGSHQLNPPSLAVLREIWHWRESEATAANKPPYFILRHEALIELAAAATEGRPTAPMIPERFSDRRRHGLAEAIKRGLEVPTAQLPQPIRHTFRRISDTVKRRVEQLQKHRDERAKELAIDPTLIASRATLLDLAEDWDAHQKDLMNWQRELLK